MPTLSKAAAIPLAAILFLGGGAIAGYTSLAGAQTATPTASNASEVARDGKGLGFKFGHTKGDARGMMGKGHGVMGKVTAVNGSTITVTGKDGKTYTVNAGSATVHRMVTGSISDVVVGDTIGVQGSVSGTTITAKEIMDDLPLPPAKQ